ncbi:hypothetical protein ACOME3_003740 [Neoechinorhynchus agilis]
MAHLRSLFPLIMNGDPSAIEEPGNLGKENITMLEDFNVLKTVKSTLGYLDDIVLNDYVSCTENVAGEVNDLDERKLDDIVHEFVSQQKEIQYLIHDNKCRRLELTNLRNLNGRDFKECVSVVD